MKPRKELVVLINPTRILYVKGVFSWVKVGIGATVALSFLFGK